MFDHNGEVAGRTPAVELVTREQAEKFGREQYLTKLERQARETILALCDDNERLVEALSDVMDWCTDDRRLPMDLFGVANAALAKHKEVFGE